MPNSNKEKIRELFSKIGVSIWDTKLGKNVPFYKRFLIRSARIACAIFCDLREGQLSLMAMSLVYTTLISLVPLLAICFSVLKGFGAHNEIKPMLEGALEPLGTEKSVEITEKIVGFIDNVQVGVLGAVGLGLLIYTVISMMQKIERAFNYTWHISKGRSFAQRFSDYLSVLLLGPLFIFLSMGITTSMRTSGAIEFFEQLPFMFEVVRFIGFLIPYFIMAVAFGFIYFFMPNTKVNFLSAFVGGLVTAVIWKSMGVLFASFVANSSNNTAIYSAFATLIVFMVWLYLAWLVLLIGASIAYYHQKNLKSLLIRENHLEISNRLREKLGLMIAVMAARNFDEDKNPVLIGELSDHFDMPEKIITDIIRILEDAGILLYAREGKVGYCPAKSIDKITVAEVMSALRRANEKKKTSIDRVNAESKKIDKVIGDIDKAYDRQAKVSLKDLV